MYLPHLVPNQEFILLSLVWENLSITRWLNSGISIIRYFSMESIANADNLSSDIELRRNVLILFNVEKHLSASHNVIGIVNISFKSFEDSLNVFPKLFWTTKSNKLTAPDIDRNSSAE